MTGLEDLIDFRQVSRHMTSWVGNHTRMIDANHSSDMDCIDIR